MQEGTAIANAYEIAMLHAAVDGAFDDRLTRHWFDAAWQLCAEYVGLTYPEQPIAETVSVNPNNGTIKLSHKPNGPVKLYSGPMIVATVAPDARVLSGNRNMPNPYDDELAATLCEPSLCCYCTLTARYSTGSGNACDSFSPTFVQAVARLFTYIAENRGDVQIDAQLLEKSGAKSFLSPHLTYAL